MYSVGIWNGAYVVSRKIECKGSCVLYIPWWTDWAECESTSLYSSPFPQTLTLGWGGERSREKAVYLAYTHYMPI